MLAVQVRRGHGGDEELRAVRVGPCIRHAKETFSVMLIRGKKETVPLKNLHFINKAENTGIRLFTLFLIYLDPQGTVQSGMFTAVWHEAII